MNLYQFNNEISPLFEKIRASNQIAYAFFYDPELNVAGEKLVHLSKEDAEDIIQLLAGHFNISTGKLLLLGLKKKKLPDQIFFEGANANGE